MSPPVVTVAGMVALESSTRRVMTQSMPAISFQHFLTRLLTVQKPNFLTPFFQHLSVHIPTTAIMAQNKTLTYLAHPS